MDEAYQAEMKRIRDRIHELRLLRDAQAPNSRNHTYFQGQINELTASLLSWEDNVPRLSELDLMVETAQTRVWAAQRAAERAAEGWLRAARGLGVVGGSLVLLSLVWTPTFWLPVTGVLLLAGAVATLLHGVRAQRETLEEVHRRQGVMAAMRQERELLLPTGPQRAGNMP